MRPNWRFLTALAFVVAHLALPVTAIAQNAPQAPAQPSSPIVTYDLEAHIAQTLAPELRYYAFQEKIKVPFMLHDLDRDGAITEVDRQRNRQRHEAMQRGRQISLMFQADLDGDGTVSAEELTIFARHLSHFVPGEGPEADARRSEQARRVVESSMRADIDGDGKIDWNEAIAHARKFPTPLGIDFDAVYRVLASYDADGDGKTTFKEYADAMERRFADVDTDGDGVISRTEFDGYWQRSGLPAPRVIETQLSYDEKLAIECAVPKPAKDDRFVLFNGYEPLALSTAAIGSQDKKTFTTKVIIEPGREPLYLVMIASNRTIWQFEGAVDRVKHLVLAGGSGNEGQGPAVGATGLSRENVTIGKSGRCDSFWVNMTERNPKETSFRTRLLFGREPDIAVTAKRMWNLRLPSGNISAPSEADQTGTFANLNPEWRDIREDLLQSCPGGLMSVEPDSVLGGQPVTRYEVLPVQAGLLQLLTEGALVRNARGDFVVTRQTRFPAGLAGGNSVSFIVPNGVPRPAGHPGHSKVTME